MPIFKGNNKISTIYKGGAKIGKVYVGNYLVYQLNSKIETPDIYYIDKATLTGKVITTGDLYWVNEHKTTFDSKAVANKTYYKFNYDNGLFEVYPVAVDTDISNLGLYEIDANYNPDGNEICASIMGLKKGVVMPEKFILGEYINFNGTKYRFTGNLASDNLNYSKVKELIIDNVILPDNKGFNHISFKNSPEFTSLKKVYINNTIVTSINCNNSLMDFTIKGDMKEIGNTFKANFPNSGTITGGVQSYSNITIDCPKLEVMHDATLHCQSFDYINNTGFPSGNVNIKIPDTCAIGQGNGILFNQKIKFSDGKDYWAFKFPSGKYAVALSRTELANWTEQTPVTIPSEVCNLANCLDLQGSARKVSYIKIPKTITTLCSDSLPFVDATNTKMYFNANIQNLKFTGNFNSEQGLLFAYIWSNPPIDLIIGADVTLIKAKTFQESTARMKNLRIETPVNGTLTIEKDAFYQKNARPVNIYVDNANVKSFDWSAEGITPTFYHLDGTPW